MKGFWFTLLFLVMALLAVSCKSTKRDAAQKKQINQEIVVSSVEEVSSDLGAITRNTIITEISSERFEKIGEEFKPVTVITKKTEISERENKNKIESKVIEEAQDKRASLDSSYLKRETEGMDVVEGVVKGVTGAFVGDLIQYIIGGIFFIVFLFVSRKLIKSSRQNIK
jgi:hypothetical protein